MTQLDMFNDYTPPARESCQVIQFPVRAWAGQEWRRRVVPATETLLARKTDQGRQNFWKREIDAIASRLEKRGASEPDIVAELNRFRAAVVEEMARQRYGSRRGPGAA